MGYELITVEPISTALGAVISGVDLGQPLGSQAFQETHDALMAQRCMHRVTVDGDRPS